MKKSGIAAMLFVFALPTMAFATRPAVIKRAPKVSLIKDGTARQYVRVAKGVIGNSNYSIRLSPAGQNPRERRFAAFWKERSGGRLVKANGRIVERHVDSGWISMDKPKQGATYRGVDRVTFVGDIAPVAVAH